VTDRRGLPLAAVVAPGHRHDARLFEPALEAVRVGRDRGRPRQRPARVIADRAFDAAWIRGWLRARGIGAVIPPKRNRKRRRGRPLTYDRALYRERNVVERLIGHLKEHRRVGTRYEKLAASYQAMTQLAFIERYFRLLDSRDKA
jgi:transposase